MHSEQFILMIGMSIGLQLLGLTFAVLIDPYISRQHRKYILLIAVLIAVLAVQNVAEFYLDVNADHILARTIVSILGYCIRPVIILLFLYIVGRGKLKAGWVIVICNGLIYMTAVFSGIAFRIDANNFFHRGPLGYTCHIVSAILLAVLIYATVSEYGCRPGSGLFIPIFNAAVIVAAVLADSFMEYNDPMANLTIAATSSALFYYIWLHLKFVREHEEALMAQQRIQIMMSQIQPHFLYNTLATIQSLCRTDPELASEVTEKFGTYLRHNLDSLQQKELIPVSREIEHTRVYAEIEVVRFPKICVEYDIEDVEFPVPALTIQPLVENAIRHGVRGVQNGCVRITTRRRPGCHEIVVSDNGKGFNVEEISALTSPGGDTGDNSHIGLRNVKDRIRAMCRGTMDIESREGSGTTICIRIPYSKSDRTE